jgi:hypothetical protein
MRPTMYFTFSLLSAVVMTVSAYPAVPTAIAVESSISSRPSEASGLVKLAEYKLAYCSVYLDDCDDDDGEY